MSRWERYPAYKDSGIEWIGEIPAHWGVEKFKHLFMEKKKTKDPTLPAGSISFGKVVTKDDDRIPIETKLSYQVVSKGEFLVNPLNLNYDLKSLRIALSNIDVVVSPGYIVLKTTNEQIYKKYFGYLLHLFDVLFMKTLGAGVRQTISFNDLANCKLPLPPLSEQKAIAEFLDRKTEQIDRAIAAKERLIALLKERRQVLIHRAVTRGLDPNAPTKDSGIEWIGEIPAHWEVRRFRHLFKFSKGLNITKEDLQDDGIPCVNYGEIHSKYGFEVDPKRHPLKCVDEKYLQEKPQALLKRGDFVFADTSEDIEGAGNFTYLNSDTPAFAGYHTIIARYQSGIEANPRYLAYLFDTNAFQNQIRKKVKGVKVYSITNAILKDTMLWLPPLKEQNMIIDKLDCALLYIHKQIKTSEKEIEDLTQLKDICINNFVTGSYYSKKGV